MQDYEIKSEFLENYRYAHDYWAPFVRDAEIYTLAASGYTWSEAERRELQKQGKVRMGFLVNHATIDARILELKWVLESGFKMGECKCII